MIFNHVPTIYTNKFKTGTKFSFLLLLIISLIRSIDVYSQSCGTTVYNNTGTYTWIAPVGVTSVTVQAWGGGGSGANGGNADGGGGGGGAYASSVITVTPGTTYTVIAGAGGVLNTNGTTRQTGVNGGSSSFDNNLVVAAGGKGGGPTPANIYAGGAGGSAGASIGTIVNAGGNGGCGDGCNTGSGPGNTGQPGTGNSAGGGGGDQSAAGGAGAGLGGNGGQGGYGNTTNCGVTSPGGGGGGSFSGPVGDHNNGGDGQVILNYVNGGCTVTLIYGGGNTMTSPNAETICSGDNVNLALVSSVTNTFTWIAAQNSNVTGEFFTSQQTTSTINNVLTNTTNTVQIVTYTVTPTNNCPNGLQSQIVNITVNPSVNITSADVTTICSGSAVNIPLKAIPPAPFTWQAAPNANVTGESTTQQTTDTINDTLFNTAAIVQTITYAVTATCATSQTVNVTVNPKPSLTVSSKTICNGQSAQLIATGANNYTWSGGITNGTAFVPAATTTYTVTGTTTTTGCSDTATATITVNSLPLVNSNVAPSDTVCAGTSITLNGTGAATYVWSNSIINGTGFVPAATATYTVTGTDVNGCSDTSTTSVTLFSVTVNATTNTVCTGGSVTLTGGGANTYVWSGGVINGVSFIPATTTTYTVTGMGTILGCPNTTTTTITVNLLPATGYAVTPSATICAGTPITLNGTGAATYVWSNGISNGTAFVPAASTTYTVTGTNTTTGCSDTATATITVNSLPLVNSALTPSDTVCAGTSVILNGTGAVTYVWSGGITNGTAFVPAATATYTVTGTDVNGCTDTNTTSVAIFSVTVSATTNTVCAGGSVTLAGGGANTYVWSGGVVNGVSFIPATTTTYTITGTSTTLGCVNTTTTTVTVNLLPTVSYSAPSTNICAGTPITLNGTGATTYLWSNGISNGTTFVPTTTTTYTVTGTNTTTGCSDTATTTITVNPLPVVSSAINPSTTVCTGTSITLNGIGASTYKWSNGAANGIPFLPAANATYTVTGTDVNGCTNTNVISVSVGIPAQIHVNSTTICKGSSAILKASGVNSYSWLPATGLSSTTDSVVTANPITTTTYTVTSPAGCGEIGTSVVVVKPSPSGSINTNGIECQSINLAFTGTNGIPPYRFTYQLSGVTQSIATKGLSDTVQLSLQNITPGKYTCYLVSVEDSNLCSSTLPNDSTIITVYQNPSALFTTSPQLTEVALSKINITDASTNANSWVWNFGDGSTSVSPNPVNHFYNDTGTYTILLVTTSTMGCKDSTHQTITITPFFTLYIPNTFTPNGDGLNEIFAPKGEGISSYNMNIYDRWGNVIFYTNDINKGWDGTVGGSNKIAQTDTYIYLINLTASSNEHYYMYNGTFNLMK